MNAPRINRNHDTYERKAAFWITAEARDTCRSLCVLGITICRLSVKPEVEIEGRREFTKDSALRISPYSETALFTALPRLCISSPMPRTVAHPSEAKTSKSNEQKRNFFFFIFTSPHDKQQQACQAVTAVKNKKFSIIIFLNVCFWASK